MSSIAQSVSSYTDWFNKVPILSPAVKKDSCEIDHGLLQRRVWKVAALAIALLVASVFFPAAELLLALLSVSIILIMPTLCLKIAERAADKKAVEEYLNKELPSSLATRHILDNVKAAKQLLAEVEKRKDLSLDTVLDRVNLKGERLLDCGYWSDAKAKWYVESFKELVRKGVDFNKEKGKRIFEGAIRCSNPKLVEFLLSEKLVKSEMFSEAQQPVLWFDIGNYKTGELLKKHGFNINSKGDMGYTPLHILAEGKFIPNVEKYELLKQYLKWGADPSIATNAYMRNTAMQLTNDPKFKAILTEHEAK